MTRSGDKDHVEIVLLNDPAQMHIDERQSRARSPVPKKPVLNVLRPQGLHKQRILLQVDHAQAEIIASSPIGFYVAKFLRTEWRGRNCGSSGTIWTESLNFDWNVGFANAH